MDKDYETIKNEDSISFCDRDYESLDFEDEEQQQERENYNWNQDPDRLYDEMRENED